jgi:hypothetical protein
MPLLESEVRAITGGRLPFWMHFRIAADDVVYLIALTLVSAAIVGVLPALKATSVNVQARLQTLSGGGGSRMQMGPLWTLLIVAQVALTVTVLPAAMFFTWDGLRLRPLTVGFASGEVVSASLTFDRSTAGPVADDDAAFASRFASAHAELDAALRADAAVIDATYSMESPGQERAMVLNAEDRPLPLDPADYNIVEGSKAGHLVRYNRIALNFLDTFGVPILVGRNFSASDLGTDSVIINRTLADRIFDGANPVGRRVKYVGRSGEAGEDAEPLERWYEVIGVVPDFPDNEFEPDLCLYHPLSYGDEQQAKIAVRVRAGDPAQFSNTLRGIAADVNPNLQLRDITTVASLVRQEQNLFRMIGVTVGLAMLSVIVLSAAGIYALMSFTVARRRREIGIRSALGADRSRLLLGIFSRALGQLGIGALVGLAGAVGVAQLLEGGNEFAQNYRAVLLPLVAAVMIIVGVLAAIGPARQGLRIQPIEALREE